MTRIGRSTAIVMLFAAVSIFGQTVGFAQNYTDVLPDFRPLWAPDSFQDMRTDTARANDRLVSCDDWTDVNPTPITGQRVISFRLGSTNFGNGHFRTRRQVTPEGYLFYQTTSLQDDSGTCYSVEYPIAVVPTAQAGRWLPLGQFALYTVAENGGVGDLVTCQVKRWCCLGSSRTCTTNPPCNLPCQGDCIDAGTRDVYPFHWQDQFVLIEGLPSGLYWFEAVVNPGNIFLESDYTNNSMFFLIEIDQEAGPLGQVRIVLPPDPTLCDS